MHARRFVQRCRSIAVEVPWNGSAFLVCRIVAQPVYRALGVEPIRHRPNATPALWRGACSRLITSWSIVTGRGCRRRTTR